MHEFLFTITARHGEYELEMDMAEVCKSERICLIVIKTRKVEYRFIMPMEIKAKWEPR